MDTTRTGEAGQAPAHPVHYVLLVSWADGRQESHPIPPGGVVELGPADEEAASPVDLYEPNTLTVIGQVVVRGAEQPEWLVAPVLPMPETNQDAPAWFAELVSELGRRYDLRTTTGLDAAMAQAVGHCEDYRLRSESCRELAKGYRHASQALAAVAEGDDEQWERHKFEAASHFDDSQMFACESEEAAA